VPVVEGTNHDEDRLFVALQFDLTGHPIATAGQYAALVQASFGAAAPAVLAQYPFASFANGSIAWATVVTDSRFTCPARAADALLSAHVPTFAYEFNDPNAPEFLVQDPVMPLRAFHAAELAYTFQPAATAGFFTAAQVALIRPDDPVLDHLRRRGEPERLRLAAVAPVQPRHGPVPVADANRDRPDRHLRSRPQLRVLGVPGRMTATVETTAGRVRGALATNGVHVFRGIRTAAPPGAAAASSPPPRPSRGPGCATPSSSGPSARSAARSRTRAAPTRATG